MEEKRRRTVFEKLCEREEFSFKKERPLGSAKGSKDPQEFVREVGWV